MRWLRRDVALALALLLAACGAAPPAPPDAPGPPAKPAPLPSPDAAVSSEGMMAAVARAADTPSAVGTRTPLEQQALVALYDARMPLWVDGWGRPTLNARDALALLGDAGRHGLEPDDYLAARLDEWAAALPEAGEAVRADFDVGLSVNVLRYWRDLHAGRIDPRTLGFHLSAPVDDHDFVALLRDAVATSRLRATTSSLTPAGPLYPALVNALARYRQLAATLEPLGLIFPDPSLKPGAMFDHLAPLHARLVALGDLPPDAPTPGPGTAYEGEIVEGIRRFQRRHGLDVDGVIGRLTADALSVPLSVRVRQLELALERLRWLPHLGSGESLAVNIPMFRLWGSGPGAEGGPPPFDMNVIVGRALDTRTPVFVEEMRYVVFRPYWNVPRSILLNEILPAFEADPSYFDREGFEIADGGGDDARVVAATDANVRLLRQGGLRLRQRPGPKNSLGLVKFAFPNDDDIFMHGTPAPQLFGRARRDFSHGCVRVEDPVALARWVLGDRPEWTEARIRRAMQAPRPERVNLTRPIPVVLYYLTATVMPDDGAVHFADDIYGHDVRLDAALRRRAATTS